MQNRRRVCKIWERDPLEALATWLATFQTAGKGNYRMVTMPWALEIKPGAKLLVLGGDTLMSLHRKHPNPATNAAVAAWAKTENENAKKWAALPKRKTDFARWQACNREILHGNGLYRMLRLQGSFLGRGTYNGETLVIPRRTWSILLLPNHWEFPYDSTGLTPHFMGQSGLLVLGFKGYAHVSLSGGEAVLYLLGIDRRSNRSHRNTLHGALRNVAAETNISARNMNVACLHAPTAMGDVVMRPGGCASIHAPYIMVRGLAV